MTASRDREKRKKRAGQDIRPTLRIKAAELLARARELGRIVYQQNLTLTALLERQRRELLEKLPERGSIQ
jgi:hypothetical protein